MYAFTSLLCVLLAPLALIWPAAALDHHGHDHRDIVHHRRSTRAPVEVSGKHEWQPPSEGQQRGPCPALNSLANHGYISRDGIVSLLEVVQGITAVFGMGIDLATILAVMGVFWTGDPISLNPSFSIGGSDPRVHNAVSNLLGAFGTAQGLDNSHNFIEADSSPTRNDLFVTGDAATMNLTRFEELYDLVPPDEPFTMDVMATYAALRFDQSIGENPYFYYGPFTGSVARNAGFAFIGRLMANHSGGDVEGILTHGTLESFFGILGSRSDFIYRSGHERIPENWYTRPGGYGVVDLNLDLVSWILKYPKLASIGGNTGTTDSFTGVDLSDPVSGLANIPSLLEGNNLMCFALEVVKLAAPSYTNNLFATLADPLSTLFDAIDTPLLSLGCPEWGSLTQGGDSFLNRLQNTYPGANNSAL